MADNAGDAAADDVAAGDAAAGDLWPDFPELGYAHWHALVHIQHPLYLQQALDAINAALLNVNAVVQQPVDDVAADPDYVGPQNVNVPPRAPSQRNRQPPARFADYVMDDDD